MKYQNWAPAFLCVCMTGFCAIMGIFTPVPSFYSVWAGMWGIFTGIIIYDCFSDNNDDDEL